MITPYNHKLFSFHIVVTYSVTIILFPKMKLEFMKEHNCKHLKNCKFASVVKYQYSDDKKGWYIQFGNVLHGIKYCPYCGVRLEDENGR